MGVTWGVRVLRGSDTWGLGGVLCTCVCVCVCVCVGGGGVVGVNGAGAIFCDYFPNKKAFACKRN